MRGKAGGFGRETAPVQHGGVEVDAIESKVVTLGFEAEGEADFEVAVAGAQTDEARGRGGGFAGFFEMPRK